MKKLVVLALVLTATFCSSPVKKNMMVNGKIDGLRKGMLYLQKMEDTLLISVDSIEIKGDDNFTLGDDIESPELSSAKIEGSENQLLWEEYQSIMRKFNQKNLENYEAFMDTEDGKTAEERAADLKKANDNLLKRKYLFALNFAMNNSEREVAAYIGAYEVGGAIPLFLDSLYYKLSPAVKSSKYGIAFKQGIDSLER